jgi:hypothetical protein
MVVGVSGSSGVRSSCCVLLLGGDDASDDSEDSSKAEDEDSGDSDELEVVLGFVSSSANSKNACGSFF